MSVYVSVVWVVNVRWGTVKEISGGGICLLLSKTTKGRPPSLMSPSDGQIVINSADAYTTNYCRGIWDLTQIYFGAEIRNWGSAPPFLTISVSGRNLKFLPCRGSNPALLQARQWLCLCVTVMDSLIKGLNLKFNARINNTGIS